MALRFGLAAALCAFAGAASAASDERMQIALAQSKDAYVEPPPVIPAVVARIDISDQTMSVYVDEHLANVFKISTARGGYVTPVGRYEPEWITKFHRSRKYHNSPMPWSVFFHGGYAIHGTTDLKLLGRPASHGCVRLHPENAKIFYELVKNFGMEKTLISVVR